MNFRYKLSLVVVSYLSFTIPVMCMEALITSAATSHFCSDLPFKKDAVTVTKVACDGAAPTTSPCYQFTFTFDASCGHSLPRVDNAAMFVVNRLNNVFYRSRKTASENIDDGHFQGVNLAAKQSLFKSQLVFDEKISLRFENRRVHLSNDMHLVAPPTISENDYQGLLDIRWNDDCMTESAHWCFVWRGSFSLVWAFDDEAHFVASRQNIIEKIMPSLFNETYLPYARFVQGLSSHDAAKDYQ